MKPVKTLRIGLISLCASLALLTGVALAAEEAPAYEEPAYEVPVDEHAASELPAALDGAEESAGGWASENGGWAYYRADGSRVYNGWVQSGGSWYCVADGYMIANTSRTIDGATYYFGENGAMVTGWQWAAGGWCWFDSDGVRQESGWLKSGGTWYYFREGHALTNRAATIGSYTYYFGASGAIETGWVWVDASVNTTDKSGWSYFYSDGTRLDEGWMKRNGAWYHFADGMMETGLVYADGVTYYCDENGVMQTGWLWLTGEQNGTGTAGWSRFNMSGVRTEGWGYVNGYWYLFVDGVMQTGWQYDDGFWYYLYPNGVIYTGWMSANGHWYYFDTNGKMRVGWKNIGGYTYYFHDGEDGPVGAMAMSCEIDGYEIDDSGHAVMDDNYRMWNNVQGYSSATDYLIAVDYTNCLIGIFQRSENGGNAWDCIRYEYCSPGAYSTPTYKGVYYIYEQGYYFDSGSSRCYYYSSFDGNQAMHSILYYIGGGIMNSSLGYHLSHGCVRLATSTAKWIYDNCDLGTTVIVYD